MLDRAFEAPAPHRRWIADFTYIWTAERWVYVAAVIDLLSRRARELGFTLEEVRAPLRLSGSDGTNACNEVREISVAHLADVRKRIADLRAMERALSSAIRQCDAGQQPGCPLIDALSR